MLFKVPIAISSDGLWPEIVTNPILCGCFYCLRLPFCRTRNHPSASIIFIISFTFIFQMKQYKDKYDLINIINLNNGCKLLPKIEIGNATLPLPQANGICSCPDTSGWLVVKICIVHSFCSVNILLHKDKILLLIFKINKTTPSHRGGSKIHPKPPLGAYLYCAGIFLSFNLFF